MEIEFTSVTTAIQYSGYFHSELRKMLEQGRVNSVTEELRVQRILEEERKRIQGIEEGKGKLVNRVI